MDEVIVVGRVGAPHGVRGDVHVHSYTTPFDNLLDYQPWLCRHRPAGRSGSRRSVAADWQSLDFLDVRTHQDHFLARIAGIEQREDLAPLKGMEIGVPRSQLPEPEEDEFYWRDLIGSRVVNTADAELGVVAGLIETGVHDVLRIRQPTPGQSELLIPFVARHVLNVTPTQLLVDWDPEWLE